MLNVLLGVLPYVLFVTQLGFKFSKRLPRPTPAQDIVLSTLWVLTYVALCFVYGFTPFFTILLVLLALLLVRDVIEWRREKR